MKSLTGVDTVTGTFLEQKKTKTRSEFLMDSPNWEICDGMSVTVQLSLADGFERIIPSLNYNQKAFFQLIAADEDIFKEVTIVMPDFVLVAESTVADVPGTLRPIIVEMMVGTDDPEIIAMFNVEFFNIGMFENILVGFPVV